MRRLKVSTVLLSVSLVLVLLPAVLAQSVTWKFPTKGNNIRANAADTVLLDWTSTLDRTILRMWCTNSVGDQAIISSFDVDPSGPFKYIIENYDPIKQGFAYPLNCHGEIADKPIGAGLDSPAGFEWINNPSLRAKTISQTAALAPTTSSAETTSSSTTKSLITTTRSTPAPTTSAGLTDSTALSPIIPTTLQTATTPNSSDLATLPTQSSTVVPPPSGSSNNIGAIVGGAIGGLALISFIALALLFLRKYQRNYSGSTPPVTDEAPSPKRGFNLLSFFKKRRGTTPAGVYEKDNDHRIYEKEGDTTQVASGEEAAKHIVPNGEEDGSQIRFSPAELPADASGNYYR